MKFHDFTPLWSHFRKNYENYTDFYNDAIMTTIAHQSLFEYKQAELEKGWLEGKRAYYNIWPAIIPMAMKVKLDIPCSDIHIDRTILLRLPEKDHDIKEDGVVVRTILFGQQQVSTEKGSTTKIPGLAVMFDIGEKTDGINIYTFKVFPLRPDLSVYDAMYVMPFHESFEYGQKISDKLINKVIQLCCCVCLIGDDPELVTPDILSKDAEKYERATIEQKKIIEERAKRRGKNGFDLGKQMEVSPHLRQSHLALFRVGKGRKNYIIKRRKGSIIHKSKITKIPTGFEENQD